jgi:hypothetical protein
MARYFPVSVYVPIERVDGSDNASTDAEIINAINEALETLAEGYRVLPLDPSQFVTTKPKKRARRRR